MGTNPSHPLAPRSVIGRNADAFVRVANLTRHQMMSRHLLSALFAIFAYFVGNSYAQDLTSLETAIRTGSVEQKRDALFQIRNLRSETASRAAIPGLRDPDPIVRATAASSAVFLPKPEAIAALAPLLADKDPFVRKEAAYSLGKVESPDAAAIASRTDRP